MNGVDPYATMQQIGAEMGHTADPAALDRISDDLEHLFEVMDAVLQATAEALMDRPRIASGCCNPGRTDSPLCSPARLVSIEPAAPVP